MKTIAKPRLIFTIVATLIISTVISCLVFNKNTSATAGSIADKWFIAGHHNCVKEAASETLPTDSNDTIENLMYTGVNKNYTVPSPSLNYAGISNSDPTCGNVLNGDSTGAFSGILSKAGLKVGATLRDVKNNNQIESLGYAPSAGKQKIEIYIRKKAIHDPATEEIQKASEYILATPIANGQYRYEVMAGDGGSPNIAISQKDNDTINVKYKFTALNPVGGGFYFMCSGGMDDFSSIDIDLPTSNSEDALAAIRRNTPQAYGLNGEVVCYNGFGSSWNVNHSIGATSIADGGYSLGDRNEAARRTVEKLAGPSDDPSDPLRSIRPSDDEYYDLYYYYLKNSISSWGDTPTTNGTLSCNQASGNSREIHLKTNEGKWHRYYLNNSTSDKSFKSLSVEGDNVSFPDINVDFIIWWMNLHEVNDESDTCPAPVGATQNNGDKNAEDSCFDAAESLGWIICPIVKGIGSAIDEFYKNVVEDLIQINVSAFDQSQGAYQAWQLFQSFANIVFVIMFLVVIISQLTGIGIDNLGIKRILPKLIIAAILVNLSFIICMLLVDAANIIGSGLYRLFDGVTFNNEIVGSSSRGAVTTLLSGLGLGAAAGAGAIAVFWIPGTIPAILLGLVGILISIIVMFVLLGIYQAGVILAVVISPIAFVMYMLPNTKNIFDRWRKLFQALLLLYPLCGLIMGGANFASKVLKSVSGDSFWMSLLAALLSVIPVFFIPTLLKGSLNAMGNIGAKISGLGKGLSGKTKGAISSSEAYQDMMARRAAGLKGDGKTLSWRGRRLESLSQKDNVIGRAAKRRWARGIASYEKRQEELNKAQKFTDPTRRQAHELSLEKALEKEGLANEMIVINSGTRNGDNEGELYRMFDEARDNGNITRMRAIAEIAGRRKDSASRFAEKLKRDTIEGKYAGEGGEDMLRDLSKQIATGDNSKNYREGNATGFEFAARTNDGSNSDLNYADWISNDENVNNVVENYLNTPEGLSGQTKAVLKELSGSPVEDKQRNVLYSANINNKTKAALSRIADKYYQNHESGNGVYYDDKEEHMQTLRGLSRNNGQSQPATSNPNRAQPNQSFNVHNSSSDTQSSNVIPGTKEYNQAADDLKKNNS